MSLARRLELIEWSRQHNAVLIEDDYDSEYRFSGPPLPSLQGLATGRRGDLHRNILESDVSVVADRIM